MYILEINPKWPNHEILRRIRQNDEAHPCIILLCLFCMSDNDFISKTNLKMHA